MQQKRAENSGVRAHLGPSGSVEKVYPTLNCYILYNYSCYIDLNFHWSPLVN